MRENAGGDAGGRPAFRGTTVSRLVKPLYWGIRIVGCKRTATPYGPMRSVPGVGRGVGRREWAHSIALVGCPNLACSCLERAFEKQIVWIDGDLTQLAMMQSVKHQGGGTRRTGLKVQGGTRRTGLTVQNGRVFRGGAVCLCARVQIRRGALLIERGMASPIVAECVEES